MFNVLNVSSTQDLTTRARIRDAAVAEFADAGFRKATVRSIAARAGVSAGLVIHHFGSKDGLKAECDAFVLDWLRREKSVVFGGGVLPTRTEYLSQHPEFEPLYRYLRRALAEPGALATAFFDRFVADVADYLAIGEAAGTVRPYADPHARAAISAAIGLGLMHFESLLARSLGGTDLLDEAVYGRFSAYTLDLYTHGMLTRPLDFAPEPTDSATHSDTETTETTETTSTSTEESS